MATALNTPDTLHSNGVDIITSRAGNYACDSDREGMRLFSKKTNYWWPNIERRNSDAFVKAQLWSSFSSKKVEPILNIHFRSLLNLDSSQFLRERVED